MKRILSGMQPTGNLHLGNYLGALKNWVKLQDTADGYFCIVDLHAITTPQDPQKLKQATRETAAAYIAAGIDTHKSTLFVQSAVPAHCELSWILSVHTPLGQLNRMTQFAEKAGKGKAGVKFHSDVTPQEQEEIQKKIRKIVVDGSSIIPPNANLGLFAYPVLMAADILIYKATHVPVGEDQKQHLELTRDVASAFNSAYDVKYFPLPEPQILGEATRVMSLRDGTKKMSKSEESDNSRINLTDDADTIAVKIRKAKTDTDSLPGSVDKLKNRPEADNLVTIYAALSDSTRSAVLKQFEGEQFSKFKKDLTDLAVAKLLPITTKMRQLLAEPAEIDKILIRGAEHANALTQKHMREIKEIIGLWSIM
ncbi:MAG: tryptophan--tRNA ligase [Alphaproteobacteria bacterium]|nr:tryptophan--tRNA ligase [Alphaproteobacteria bacterium]